MNELEVTIVESATAATAAATAAAEVGGADAQDAYESARTLTAARDRRRRRRSRWSAACSSRAASGGRCSGCADVLGQVAEGDLTVRAGTVGGGAELGRDGRVRSTPPWTRSATSSASSATPPGGWPAPRPSSTAAADAMAQNARTAADAGRRRSSPRPARWPPASTPWPPAPRRWESAIREIARNATQAATVAYQAADGRAPTRRRPLTSLGESAPEIGQVIR